MNRSEPPIITEIDPDLEAMLPNQQTTDKEVVMNDRNIHNANLAQVVQLIEGERRVLEELINNNSTFHSLRDAWADLGEAIDLISGADMEWFEELEADADEPLDMSGNWDAVSWSRAANGDRIMLRDPKARDNGGPVYVIDGVPAYRSDNTLSVTAELIGVAGNRWNWPNGPALMEFCETCWQVWRDFSVQ